jgi:hypothetical protein
MTGKTVGDSSRVRQGETPRALAAFVRPASADQCAGDRHGESGVQRVTADRRVAHET